jgi:hypothetical protein
MPPWLGDRRALMHVKPGGVWDDGFDTSMSEAPVETVTLHEEQTDAKHQPVSRTPAREERPYGTPARRCQLVPPRDHNAREHYRRRATKPDASQTVYLVSSS